MLWPEMGAHCFKNMLGGDGFQDAEMAMGHFEKTNLTYLKNLSQIINFTFLLVYQEMRFKIDSNIFLFFSAVSKGV